MSSLEQFEIAGFGNVALRGDCWRPDPEQGSKGVVLLLHGGGQTRHSWSSTAARLAGGGWTAVATDARGHGDSAWAADADGYQLEALVEDLKATVEWIGEPPIVLGASMGGLTAMVGEGENPGLLRALVLVDVAPSIEPDGAEKIAAFMRSGAGGFAGLEEAADAIAAYNPHRPRSRNLDGLRKNLRRRPDGRWYWHWDPALLARDAHETTRGVSLDRRREAASRIRVPTLLVRGAHSDIISVEGAQEFLELVPGSRLVEVPQAGHMVAGDDNDLFTSEVEQFLASVANCV
jgi:pimeloyl-ACP methyl ester carboxylesterase